MAITFNPTEKIIQLDTFNVSEKDIWTAMVNWSALDENLKYGINIEHIGGYTPIALYVYLKNGWRIRPKEADGITVITGNLLTEEGDSPIVSTIGNWNTLVQMQTPIAAIGVSNTTVGVTEIHTALDSYQNKDDYKNDPDTIANAVLDSTI